MERSIKVTTGGKLKYRGGFLLSMTEKLNTEIYKKYPHLKGKLRYRKDDLAAVFSRFRGRCAYCGCELTPLASESQVRFVFYIPLKNGGSPEVENLLPVCRACQEDSRPTQRQLARIPILDGIPDLIEKLVLAVRQKAAADAEANATEYLAADRNIRALKSELNVAFEELTIVQRYAPEPKKIGRKPLLPKEGRDTISDLIESMAEVSLDPGVDSLPKEELSGAIEQIAEAKRYKVVRV